MNEAAAIAIKVIMLLAHPLTRMALNARRRKRLRSLKRVILAELAEGLDLWHKFKTRGPEFTRQYILQELMLRIQDVEEKLTWYEARLAEFEMTPRDSFGLLGRGTFRALIADTKACLAGLKAREDTVRTAQGETVRELYLGFLSERLHSAREDLELVLSDLHMLGDESPDEALYARASA